MPLDFLKVPPGEMRWVKFLVGGFRLNIPENSSIFAGMVVNLPAGEAAVQVLQGRAEYVEPPAPAPPKPTPKVEAKVEAKAELKEPEKAPGHKKAEK